MYITTLLATAFAALAASAPTTNFKRAASPTYYGVSININTSPIGSTPVYEPAPVEINKLANLGNNTFASQLIFDTNATSNVNVNSIECRAYHDETGVMPGSAPFTNAQPAQLSTNLVQVGSILCYVTENS